MQKIKNKTTKTFKKFVFKKNLLVKIDWKKKLAKLFINKKIINLLINFLKFTKIGIKKR